MPAHAALPSPPADAAPPLAQLDDALNAVVAEGGFVEGVRYHYAEGVVMREGAAEPVRGRAANLARERAFASGVAWVHDVRLLARAVSDEGAGAGVTMSEWSYDLTLKSGERVRFDQAAVRRWRDGQVVSERFYRAG